MDNNDKVILEEPVSDFWNVWYSELHNQEVGLSIKIKKMLYSGESEFQRIDVLDSCYFGKMLILYGSIMITEKDEFIYHEMITHVPMFTHPDVQNALIIGGGDGGTLRELIKHQSIKKITQVEIDKKVIEVSKKYFPEVAKEFDNPKVKLVYEDGAEFIKKTEEKYDLIIIDSSDPVGPAISLFSKSFYSYCFNALNDDGILTAQTESPFFNKNEVRKIYKNLKDIFPIVKMYLAYVPTYPSSLWSFALCSKKYDPVEDFDNNRYKNLNLKTNYYNCDIHKACFSLPNFVKELL